MKPFSVAISGLLLILAWNPANAKIAIMETKEMIRQSDLIAVVEIVELISTDKTRVYVDLKATGQVSRILKGSLEGAGKRIEFRIPRFFPCAGFDVSTGSHLVFLKKNEEGELAGVNWHRSYIYLRSEEPKVTIAEVLEILKEGGEE